MEIVEKQAPINDAENRRKAGYYITDPLCLFYYRYIFRFLSQRSVLDEDVFFDRYIQKDFEEKYVPRMFERICKQYLIRQNRVGNINPPFDLIGKYYYDDPKTKTNGEFDIVTQDPNGFAFYEAKFRKEPISEGMIREEMKQVQNSGLTCYKFGFFSRSGFSCQPESSTVSYTLADLYA